MTGVQPTEQRRPTRWMLACGGLGLVAVGSLVAVYRLMVDRGRLLARLDALEARALAGELQDPDSGESQLRAASLPAGTAAPAVRLRDLDGNQDEVLGGPVVLAFLDPGCEPCRQLVPMLSDALHPNAAPAPELVIISSGTPAEARQLTTAVKDHARVLSDPDRRVSDAYAVAATPSAYHVDADGTIDRPIALGGDEILRMVAVPATIPGSEAGPRPLRVRPITESKIDRAGLTPGTAAPDFDLPAVGGGRLSLADFQGRRLLLVFEDPDCKPCEALAPELERVHSEGGTAVAVISRGDLTVNTQKQSDLGLTYPVGLQHRWRTSRDYATFATPAGYLIDEHGAVTSPVAVGRDRILALIGGTVMQPIEGRVQ